ncbi:SMP-30/gluconolactonase/LRE family protein [Steroidobacter sp.]|uniref:SMP-30/gluconolactonase/LRE family protein n=1 Tax=Steroidobacter sp. TaxID=1978227 RepID=UPI001A5189FF|nr:SMP-30/gluconolactonase/LRE family protein [Steroidobacter sp.]MBL8270762.1 SMP-30/gluconolactonase/LRE family protein [Steroidobacter sp.]
MSSKVDCVCAVGAQLGEGPLWSAADHAVWFVDIKGRQIHRFDTRSSALTSWQTPEEVGFIVKAPVVKGQGGRFVAGMKSGLYSFEAATGKFELIVRVDSDRPRNRLNDGYVDAHGRLWFGTMDNDESHPTGSLYRFDTRGLKRCDTNYVITNGPAVSPDGRTLYHVDTLERVIYAFDLKDGDLAHRRVFTHITQPGAYPDGAAVDSAGNVWIGLFGGWGVQRYSPEGQLLETIDLPVANCTKVAFGGADLRTLYITTAWKGLSKEQLATQPLAGGLFATRVDSAGVAPNEVRYDG